MNYVKSLLGALLMLTLLNCEGPQQEVVVQSGNPLLPGYFADPTIKKFGDMYYIYATTDGIKLASGEPQVWFSQDLIHWYNQEMDIALPEGLTNCWAPDVQQGADGKYYYFMGNCQFGCNIYGYVSDTPIGPWTPIQDGIPVIPVGAGKERLPALDAQFFVDDDGAVYSYFGTWCTSFGGMGWAKHDPNNEYAIVQEGFIPIEQIPEAFEAAYMIKKDSIYFLMYSAGDCRLSSYQLHYAWARHPEGPFYYGKNNPILETNQDGTIDGPGHHSVLQEGENYYVFYHRHDNPHSSGGEFRQVCMDKMALEDAHTLAKISPTHSGVRLKSKHPAANRNRALQAKASASSHYQLNSIGSRYTGGPVDHEYLPGFAIDDDNGTLWKASGSTLPQSLTVDLGEQRPIRQILTQFEYPTFYYQYKIEVSGDGADWQLFADQTTNQTSGSPMVDVNNIKGQYVRWTITGTEKTGMYAAIWNVKIYDQTFDVLEVNNRPVIEGPGVPSSRSILVDLQLEEIKTGQTLTEIPNRGSLEGVFKAVGSPVIANKKGVKALKLDGQAYLELDKKAPPSLDWNAPFTAAAWVLNPEVGLGECLMLWNTRANMLQGSYAALMYGSGHFGAVAHGDGAVDISYNTVPSENEWHHIVVTFDGMKESIYVDGQLDRDIPMNLFVEADRILIGASGPPRENFTGYIASAQLFDKHLSESEIRALMQETDPRSN